MITDDNGIKWQVVLNENDTYTLRPVQQVKPVKKTEKEKIYMLQLGLESDWPYSEDITMTPTTANKLSEAISALVEFVTIEDDGNISVFGKKNVAYGRFEDLIRQARQSFQESQ